MTAPALIEVAADPMAAVRALNRMRAAGFSLALEDSALAVSPADRLSEEQRRFIRAHKPALVNLLLDAEIAHRALALAGPAGLGWMEGTPADWSDARLLAADEVLYGDGRLTTRWDRRYLREHAPEPDADSLPGDTRVGFDSPRALLAILRGFRGILTRPPTSYPPTSIAGI